MLQGSPTPAASNVIGRLWARTIRIGRDPAMLPSAARYVVLTNIFALLGAVFSLGFAPLLLVTHSWIYPALQVVYALGYLPPLWLNWRGHHTAATTWLVLGSHAMVVSQVLVEGMGFDVQLFFFLHAVLPFMVFAPRHNAAMVLLSMLAAIDLVAVVIFQHALPQLGPAISPDALRMLHPVLLFGLFLTIGACAASARNATLLAEDAADRAHQRSEDLLLNILPMSIAARLKEHGGTIADGFGDVTVLFADIVGFTTLAARLPPDRVVTLLNGLFCAFDDAAGRLGLEKIKTIGDCYMVAGGLPQPRADHAEAVAEMALAIGELAKHHSLHAGESIRLRVGMHSGPVVAGVIGKRKFSYDLWGDTVNTASRMESHGLPGEVQLSSATYRLLHGKYRMRARGVIDVKGKGAMETWILEGPAADDAGVEVKSA